MEKTSIRKINNAYLEDHYLSPHDKKNPATHASNEDLTKKDELEFGRIYSEDMKIYLKHREDLDADMKKARDDYHNTPQRQLST